MEDEVIGLADAVGGIDQLRSQLGIGVDLARVRVGLGFDDLDHAAYWVDVAGWVSHGVVDSRGPVTRKSESLDEGGNVTVVLTLCPIFD